jgi:hypothetical protein
MIPHYTLLIHGMGDERSHYGKELIKTAGREFSDAIKKFGHSPAQTSWTVSEAMWSDITQRDQDHVWSLLFQKHLGPRVPSWPWTLGHPLKWLRRLRYWSYGRKFVLNYLGDPIAYVPGLIKYQEIHRRISDELIRYQKDAIRQGATAQNPALLTVVAHSLGSVIFSDLFHDMARRYNTWPSEIRLANFFSLGSPITLYRLRYGAQDPFNQPLLVQDPDGLWINVFDPQDILGYPLKPLNPEYHAAVFADKEINAGQWWNPLHWLQGMTPFSHLLYWKDAALAQMIGRKAALDWLRLNDLALAPKLKPLYDDYKAWVRGKLEAVAIVGLLND